MLNIDFAELSNMWLSGSRGYILDSREVLKVIKMYTVTFPEWFD